MKKLITTLLALMMIGFTSINAQSILLVQDNGYSTDRVEVIETALQNIGKTYTLFDAVTTGASPTADFMEPFDVVIWYTGNDSGGLFLWNGDDTDNEELKTYLDNGGKLWLQGLDFLYDVYGSAADTFAVGDFVYDYLGIEQYAGQSHIDDGVYSDGVPFFQVVDDNGIFTLDSILWSFSTLWYADALVAASEDVTTLYEMGPNEYDFGGYASSVLKEKGDARIMTISAETARFDAQWRLDTFMAQGLRYFEQFASTITPVESISISTASGNDFIDVKGGTLQFMAAISPMDATNQNVAWTLEDNEANATISTDGVLSSSGISNGNGTVNVVATALDGSGITASMMVTISNQGSSEDYEVLLVNDNANGSDRYLVLEDALINNGYNYMIYNTALTNDYPEEDLLNVFDAVVWYTGNDGVNLNLWDTSDTLDYKFNAPLINYLDNGGIVWLSGLDFFYDVYGAAPFPAGSEEFQAGQFVYDYMGVKKYVAQTYADDGNTGVPQLDVVPDNGICEYSPILWAFATLWYADALAITDNAQGVYRMGPNDYVYNPFYAGVYNEHDNSRLLTFTVEMARLDNQDNTGYLVSEILESFRTMVGTENETPLVQDFSVYPNPTKSNVQLAFELEEATVVSVNLFSMTTGELILTEKLDLAAGQQTYEMNLNGSHIPAGTYFVTLQSNNKVSTKKLVLMK